MGFSDFWSRVTHGVDPWTALTTGTPTAGARTGGNTYVAPANAHIQAPPKGGGGQVQGAAAAPPPVGPYTDTTAKPAPDLTPYKNSINQDVSTLQGLYNTLFGQVDTSAQDQRHSLDQNYQTQQSQLNSDFQNNLGQIGSVYAGRGLADSSYLGDARNQATQTYNNSVDSMNQDRGQKYSQLGQWAAGQKAQFGAGREQLGKINLGEYTQPNELINLRNQLDSQIGQLHATQAGLGTNAQYQGSLNAIAPGQQQGSAQLAKQLQTLTQSSSSPYAKNQIASGLIRSAVADPRESQYWSDYYQNLQKQSATA